MSAIKRLIEKREEQRGTAIRIAVQAGVLTRCEHHSDCVFEGGHDVTDAYKLGNYQLKAGMLGGTFGSPREMTDCIKSAVSEHFGDECPRCAKFMAD